MSARPRPEPGPIYAIADADALAPRPVAAAVAAMAEAGVRTIQLRAKRWSGRQWHQAVADCCRLLAGSGTALWVDDRADLAALFAAAGVRGLHLGQADLPAAAARRVLGGGPWIGMSTHDEAQLLAAAADPEVDLIAVGPIFPTTSKTGRWDGPETALRAPGAPAGPEAPDAPGGPGEHRPAAAPEMPRPVGLELIRWARARTGKPLVAIGGIDAARVGPVLAAGADAAVVLGAVCRGDLTENCRLLLAAGNPCGSS